MEENTSKIHHNQIDGNIVSSISGPSVNTKDPKNPTIPEIPSVDLVNYKANKDGSNTIGGIWNIDYIMSDLLTQNKQVLRVRETNSIEYGNKYLKSHVFLVDSSAGLKIKIGDNVEGQIWHQFNFNPNDYAKKNDVYTKNEIGDIDEVIPNWADSLNNKTASIII